MNDNMYGFLLNMWIMNRIEVDYLDAMVKKSFITADEKEMIAATPQVD